MPFIEDIGAKLYERVANVKIKIRTKIIAGIFLVLILLTALLVYGIQVATALIFIAVVIALLALFIPRSADAPGEIVKLQEIVKVVNEAANILLTSKENDTMAALFNGMAVIGNFLNVDRAQIWYQEKIDGELCFVLQYEWLSELGKQKKPYPAGFTYNRSNDSKWFDSIARDGKNVNTPVSKLPHVIKTDYEKFDVVSTAISPMISDNEIIGFFSVQDCKVKRTFTTDEMDIMESVGLMFANVYSNATKATNLIESERTKIDALAKEEEMRERAQFMLDAAPLIVQYWDENFNCVDCNQLTLDFYGFKTKDDYFEGLMDALPDYQEDGVPSWDKWNDFLERIFNQGSCRIDFLETTLSGEPAYFKVDGLRTRHNHKNVAITFSTNVTTLMKSEKIKMHALEKEREAYVLNQTLIDSAPYVIGIWDKEHKMVRASNQAIKMFGVPDPQIFVDRFEDFSPKFQPCGTPSMEKALQLILGAYEKGEAHFEWMHITATGEDLPVEITAKRFNYAGADLLVTFNRDLRLVKAAEQNEREASEMVRILMDLAPTVIEIWDDKYNVIDCNKQTLKLFGVSSVQAFVENYYRFSPAYQPCGTRSKKKSHEFAKQAYEEGIARFEWMHLTASGEELPVETTFVRHVQKGKSIIIGYNYDLRPVRKAMADVQRSEIAEASNIAKSRFLARMSHEIRTPITAVMGISEIALKDSGLAPRLEEYFAKIHNSASQLLGIVNGVLDLSKIEAGKMELIPEEYEVASMIVDTSHLHVTFCESKSIEFNLVVDENIPTYLVGDVIRIIQILNNLLSNAFKYTESGSVTLSLSFQNETLIISIKDTGYGMTAEELKDLRTEYTRYHERTDRNIEGTGLGYPIVFSLVKMMNAKIEIDSEVGVGTVVTVRIPQKTIGSQVLGRDLANSLQHFDEVMKTAKKRFDFEPEPMPYGSVLVVDDTNANLFVAKGLLTFYSLDIETCTSGYDAIKLIEQGNVYDIIFMDHMMPGINGTETMQKLREMGYSQPILVLTANAMIGQAEQFIQSGFDGFISKPIQTKRLNDVLIKHIKDKQPSEVIAAANANKSATVGDIHSFQRDPSLVMRLRADFGRRNKNAFAEICNALDAGDYKTAHRWAHTIKGLAGMIFENELMMLAEDIEKVLATGELPASTQLSALEQELVRVLKEIGEIETPETVTNEYLSVDESLALLAKVEPLLIRRNMAAARMVDEFREIKGAETLCSQIEGFDFKTALETLNVLRAELEAQI